MATLTNMVHLIICIYIYIYMCVYVCANKLTIIDSKNGSSPGWHQAINCTYAGIASLGTNFSKTLIEIYTFSFKKMHLKMASAKWRLFRLDFNELIPVCMSICMVSGNLFGYCYF